MKQQKVIVSVILGVLLVGGGTVLAFNQPKPVQTVEQSTTLVVSESVTSAVKESVKDEKAPETTEMVKVEETTTTVATPTEKPADESSQPVNQVVAAERPTQPKPQANPTPAPQPVETTTRQTTRQTTQATTKPVRVTALGNSGREFKTYEEAMAWGRANRSGKNQAFVVYSIFYSDYEVHGYSLNWEYE